MNVQSQQRLIEIDPATDRIIACQGDDTLLALDMRTMRVTSSFDIGQDPDVVDFDPQMHLLYVAGEAEVVSMFKADAGRGHGLATAASAPMRMWSRLMGRRTALTSGSRMFGDK
ncbi:YncE family protein [Caballeronia mineralivorans]|uniref:hypothetical protein n=1 Tax=Caballeronia mineralivorans TaxID=2010198 RepID=UPI00128C838A|nr:hypothetical protein [Caballeronia mineralivorans]